MKIWENFQQLLQIQKRNLQKIAKKIAFIA